MKIGLHTRLKPGAEEGYEEYHRSRSYSVAQLDESLEMFEFNIPPVLWQDLKAEGLLHEDVPTP